MVVHLHMYILYHTCHVYYQFQSSMVKDAPVVLPCTLLVQKYRDINICICICME